MPSITSCGGKAGGCAGGRHHSPYFISPHGKVHWWRVRWISTDVGVLSLLRDPEQRLVDPEMRGLGKGHGNRARREKALGTESE